MTGALATRASRALGTTAQVTVTAPQLLDRAEAVVHEVIAAFDHACSRFRDDSELAGLNRAGGRWYPAGPLLVEAVAIALEAAAATGGLVDPTIGRALIGLGYDGDFATRAARAEPVRVRVRTRPAWRSVRIDAERGAIRLPAGVSLDLGATAKAFAADRAAARAHAACGCGVLVSLGGDIAIAGPPPTGGYAIRIADDHREHDCLGPVVAVAGGGIATSSTTVRRWRVGADEHHHVVDPRTGRPAAEVWRTVTVCGTSCVRANTASTAAIVQGEAAPAWLAAAGLPARLVRRDGSVELAGGWPEEAR